MNKASKELSPSFLFGKVNKIVALAVEQEGLSFETAATWLYNSQVYALLEYESSKLWHYSPVTLLSLLKDEQAHKLTFPEEAA